MALTEKQKTARNFKAFYEGILPYLNGGGMGMKLLWENPNPTSAFAAQNVALGSSDYDMCVITFRRNKSVDEYTTLLYVKDVKHMESFSIPIASGVNTCYREVSNYDSSTLAFGNGYKGTGTGASVQDNDVMIPYRIYGIKVYNRDVPGKTTLLWSNPDPSSAFAAQNIELANSDYDQLHIVGIRSLSNPFTIDGYVEKGKDGNLSVTQATSGGVKCESRYFTRTNDTKYAVDTGIVASGSTAATSDTSVAIPLYIYGIKF